MKEQTIKDVDRAFEVLNDIKIISEALIAITERECCHYGFEEACELAEKYVEEVEG